MGTHGLGKLENGELEYENYSTGTYKLGYFNFRYYFMCSIYILVYVVFSCYFSVLYPFFRYSWTRIYAKFYYEYLTTTLRELNQQLPITVVPVL